MLLGDLVLLLLLLLLLLLVLRLCIHDLLGGNILILLLLLQLLLLDKHLAEMGSSILHLILFTTHSITTLITSLHRFSLLFLEQNVPQIEPNFVIFNIFD